MLDLFKWLHLISAATYVGGMIFLATSVIPYARSLEPQERSAIIRGVGRKFRIVSWVAIVILIITGFGMLGLMQSTGLITSNPYLIAKLLLFVLMILLSLAHDMLIGRASTGDPKNVTLRTFSSWSGRITLLLGLAVIALATQIFPG